MTLWETWRHAFRAAPKRVRVSEGPRLEDIASLETLAEVWSRVKANKGGPGGDGVTIAELAPEIERSLEALSAALLAETYRPLKLRRAFIKKANGGRRPLSIPAVIDRVAQTAAMLALEPDMDIRMSETSLAYRVGRGPPHAIAAVERAFAAGLVWTVDADIKSYFDTIWQRQLLTDLAIWIDDERILRLILRCAPAQAAGARRFRRGVFQSGRWPLRRPLRRWGRDRHHPLRRPRIGELRFMR